MSYRFGARGLLDPRIIKFLSVGVLNTVFGYSVYALLIFFSVPYLKALFFATVVGIVFNYFSFGKMVFKGHAGWFVFGKFVVTYAIIYITNAALLRFLTNDFLLTPYVGQGICLPVSVIFSWLLMNFWVFKKDRNDA